GDDHLLGDRPADDHQIRLARAGAQHFHAKARLVEAAGRGGDHLDRAARQAERHRPDGIVTAPVVNRVEELVEPVYRHGRPHPLRHGNFWIVKLSQKIAHKSSPISSYHSRKIAVSSSSLARIGSSANPGSASIHSYSSCSPSVSRSASGWCSIRLSTVS